jgi:hypothetical protein
VPLTESEAATAIFLAKGDLAQAARLLKVDYAKLSRFVRRSYQLRRIQSEVRAQ